MPTISEAHRLATRLHQEGKLDLAGQIYRNILAVEPDYAPALHLLGALLHQQGQPEAAMELIRRAIAVDGTNAIYYGNLGMLLRALGRFREAEDMLRQGLAIEPDSSLVHTNLGLVLSDQKQFPMAIPHFQQALQLNPNDVNAARGLGYAAAEVGLVELAFEAYGRAQQIEPHSAIQVLMATLLPVVYQSTEDMARWRARFVGQVERLIAEGVAVDLGRDWAVPMFGLAYHGQNDLAEQRRLARLVRVPPLERPARPRPRSSGRIRVGFHSCFFSTHTIGRLMRGTIARLARDEFEVVVLSSGTWEDAVTRFIRLQADEFITLPSGPGKAQQAVADADLDVLVHCDVGMSAVSASLAPFRLAPVQCVFWGHPVTTGLPAIDYFLSSRLLEPPEADAHYSEKLVLMRSATPFVYRPRLVGPAMDRAALHLPERGNLYVCPQSIYKFHPAFDAILGEILRRDPQGRIVLIRWAYPQSDALLADRLRQAMPDVADRVVFIPRLQQGEFLHLLAASDVLLDPIHFGGGLTGLEGLALGKPIVTWPSPLLRGRITAGLYREMGLSDCTAADARHYVDIAVRLGTDPAYRREIQDQILASNKVLFENDDAVRQWESFLRTAAGRNGETGTGKQGMEPQMNTDEHG